MNDLIKKSYRPISGENRKGGYNFYTTLPANHEGFMKPGEGLYTWSTLLGEKAREFNLTSSILKIGQYGSDGEAKYSHQTIGSYWQSAPQSSQTVPVLLHDLRLTKEILAAWVKRKGLNIKTPKAKHVEGRLHKKWKKEGRWQTDGNGTEWFEITLQEAILDMNEEVYGCRRLHSWQLRPSQQSAADKIYLAHKGGERIFLLGALMRFGKNVTWLSAAKKINPVGNHLSITQRPKVQAGLREDLESHVSYTNAKYHDLKSVDNKAEYKLSDDKMDVVGVSLQLTANKISGEDTMKFLLSQKWDSVMFDECHRGELADTYVNLAEKLNADIIIKCSGTPFKAEAIGIWNDDNSFFFTYKDQQLAKLSGESPDAVTLKVFTPAISDEVRDLCKDRESRFSLNAFTAVDPDTDQFVFAGQVTNFVKTILGKTAVVDNFIPSKLIDEGDEINHSFWLMNGVKECVNMKRVINKVAPEYEVILACDNYIKDVATLNRIIATAKRKGKKTISLSCDRFVEGSTEKEWNAVFHLSDCKSVEKYWQASFRGGSPDAKNGKDVAYIFDFSPQRTLEMRFELIAAGMKKKDDTDAKQELIDYHQLMPIYDMTNADSPRKKQVSPEDILEHIRGADYTSATIQANYKQYLSNVNVDDDELVASFGSAKAINQITYKFDVNDNDYKGAKNKIISQPPSDGAEKDKLEDLVKKIVGVVTTLPAMAEIYNCNSVEQILDEVDDATFFSFTRVSTAAVRKIIAAGMLDTKWINFRL